jgi:hypothetical protein
MSLEQQQYPDRRFVIFNVTELNQIIFGQVFETSVDTVRKSIPKQKHLLNTICHNHHQ